MHMSMSFSDGGDYDAYRDDFTLISTDDLQSAPPGPLMAYPDVLSPAAIGRNPDISPWSEPVGNIRSFFFPHTHAHSQPRKRTMAFPYKHFRPSTSSASSVRSRPSDSHSIAGDTYVSSVSDMSIADPRRGKGSLSFFSDIIMKKRPRSKLASSDSINDAISPFATFTPNPSQLSVGTYISPLHHGPSPDPLPALPPLPKRDKDRSRKRHRLNKHPPLPAKDEPLLTIDTDFTHIEDFINMSAISDSLGPRPSASSAFDSSTPSLPAFTPPSPSISMFTDPFRPSAVSSKRRHRHDHKISPKTIMDPYDPDPDGGQLTEREWTAPESWAIEKEGGDAAANGASSSSEESVVASSSRTPDNSSTATDIATKKRMRRKTHYSHRTTSSASSTKFVLVRVYRANGSYHVAQIPPHATVADLTPSLNAKVLRNHERESHKLYLKERGRGMYTHSYAFISASSPSQSECWHRRSGPPQSPVVVWNRRDMINLTVLIISRLKI